MEKFLKKYYRWFFAAVAIILLYPTLQKGYIMLLDWDITPFITFSDIKFSTDSIGWIIYKLLAIVFSFGILQRILLFVIVYFLGIAGFRLAKRTKNIYARYFAGLFLIFNPFIYARLVEQVNVIAGSVLFLWFLVYFLEYLEDKKPGKLIVSSIIAALAISIFPHCIFLVATAFFILLIFNYFKNKDWKTALKTILIFWAILLILNGNWLFTMASGNSQGVGGVQNFSQADWETFKTKAIGGDSVYFTVLSLQGYWGEYQDRFVSIRENPLWLVAFLLIFCVSIFGLIKTWRSNIFTKPLLLLFAIAFVLAVGIASPIFKPISVFLYNHAPFYIGLREPQKWVIVMVFVYAYLGSWGIKYILEIKKIKNYKKEVGIFLAILPVIFSFSIIQGMHEHLAPHNFPTEWQEAKNFLDKNPTNEKVLFLPWHSYMNFDFAEKNIIIPVKPYFGENIVQANNTEFGKLYSHSADKQTLAIEKYIATKDNTGKVLNFKTFPEDMKKLGIEKVILSKTEDWQKYSWLDTIGAKKVLENDKLIIYNLP